MEITPLQTKIKAPAILLIWGLFCAGYFGRYPLPGFLPKTLLLALAAIVLLSAYGYGARLVARCGAEAMTGPEHVVFSSIAGFGLLSLGMILLGIPGFWNKGGTLVLVSGGLLLGWNKRELLLRLATSRDPDPKPAARLPIFLILTGAFLSLVTSFSPGIYYDTLVYHYALPQSYALSGHWVGQTQLIYSAFPQLMEMLYTLSMILANDLLANLVGWTIMGLGGALVYLFGKRYLSQNTGAWAAALLFAMPTYLLLSGKGYVDGALAVFAFGSLYALCLWRENKSTALAALGGFFAGMAFATKYTGAIPLAIGGLYLVIESFRSRERANLRSALVYSATALSVMGPWLIKNLIYVGNPVFPFLYSWHLRPVSPWVEQAASGYFRGLVEYAPRSGWHLIKLVWDVIANGYDFGNGMDVVGTLGWAPFFAFLPSLLLIKKLPVVIKLLLVYAVCFFIPWGMTRPVLRFLVPLLPVLAILAAYGYDQGVAKYGQGIKVTGGLLLGALLLSNFQLYAGVTDFLGLFRVPLGIESRDEYLSKKLDYYGAAQFLNTLPVDTYTYVVGDQRGFYYRRPILVTPVFNTNPLTQWANDSRNSKELLKHLTDQGFTHLLINRTEFERLNSAYHLFPFTPQGQKNWEELQQKLCIPKYRDRHCEVLQLL